MIEFLRSIKSDLLSRRLLPLVALLSVALIAAVGYAVTGGSSSGAPAPSAASSGSTTGQAGALPVAVAVANPDQAVSETPGGTRFQSQGPTRDPFVPLPSPPAATSTSAPGSSAKTGGSSSSGSPGAGGSSGGNGSGGAQKAPAPSPKKSTKPPFPYIVSVLFGRASTTPGQPATLAPYENIKLLQPLPSKQNKLLSFDRVTASGDGAVFTLVAPPILHGSGICLPSTSECQTIDLRVGHAEELEYIEADGQAIVYELKVVSITKRSTGANAAQLKRDIKPAKARFKARAAQEIGWANAVQLSSSADTARSTRR